MGCTSFSRTWIVFAKIRFSTATFYHCRSTVARRADGNCAAPGSFLQAREGVGGCFRVRPGLELFFDFGAGSRCRRWMYRPAVDALVKNAFPAPVRPS